MVKLGDLTSVLREYSRYGELAAKLPVGLGAHILHAVDAGAGQRGALVYQLASDAQSLFGLLKSGDPLASGATQRLCQKMSDWVVDAPVGVRTLMEIRRGLIGDFKLREAGWDYQLEREIELQVRESMAHGDLHGANVLVDAEGSPTLIDYGDVRRANAALDPVTLELSVVFHPDVAGAFGGWPTVDQASNWADVDAYCESCPAPVADFVRTCREWARSVAAGDAELLASAYGYAVRQLKYDEPTAPLARAIADSTLTALRM